MNNGCCKILIPYNPREAFTVAQAAERAGKSVGAIREWCRKYGIGRMVVGEMTVSRVALEMLLENNFAALGLLHDGNRHHPDVQAYLDRFDF